MKCDTRLDAGWLVITLRGNAAEVSNAEWQELRSSLSWTDLTKAICDVAELTGASDRAVETLVGMAADAHHRGGKLVLVGMGHELHARFGVMGASRYLTLAATVEEARRTFDLAR